VPPPELEKALEGIQPGFRPSNLAENLNFYSRIAEATFEHHGNHMPMLMLFDASWRPMDFAGTEFADQAAKYIFWRGIADRIAYLRPESIIWVSEAWVRDAQSGVNGPAKNMPIVGENLHMIAMRRDGETLSSRWAIRRPSPDAPPQLERLAGYEAEWNVEGMNFLAPIRKAFGLPMFPLQ
jgi:hypothetical protein